MVAFTVAIRIDLVTLFPAMADGFLQESVIGKAIDKGLIAFKAHDLRAYSKDKHRKVDDMPYGGGPGMLMSCQPLFDAVDALATPDCEVVALQAEYTPIKAVKKKKVAVPASKPKAGIAALDTQDAVPKKLVVIQKRETPVFDPDQLLSTLSFAQVMALYKKIKTIVGEA